MSAIRSARLVERISASDSARLGHRLRVLTWNVHKETSAEFVSELRRLLDSGKPDLILLQEAAIARESSNLPSALGDGYWAMSANLSDPSRNILYGVLVASRARPSAVRAMLSKESEPLLGTAKSALLLRYPIDDDTLTVVDLHALNFSPRHDAFARQLSDIQEALGSSPGPCVVAGDFNTWSAKKRSLADSILLRSGLVAVEFEDRKSPRTTVFGNPLDHIYYTPRHLRFETAGSQIAGPIRYSDHLPLQAEFLIVPRTFKTDSSSDRSRPGSSPTDRSR